MKTHQPWVVSSIPVAQQIPFRCRLAHFTVEPQSRHDLSLWRLPAVGRVGNLVGVARVDFRDNRVFEIYCEQHRASLALVLWVNGFGLSHLRILRKNRAERLSAFISTRLIQDWELSELIVLSAVGASLLAINDHADFLRDRVMAIASKLAPTGGLAVRIAFESVTNRYECSLCNCLTWIC